MMAITIFIVNFQIGNILSLQKENNLWNLNVCVPMSAEKLSTYDFFIIRLYIVNSLSWVGFYG